MKRCTMQLLLHKGALPDKKSGSLRRNTHCCTVFRRFYIRSLRSVDDTLDIVDTVDLTQIGNQRPQVFRIPDTDRHLGRCGDPVIVHLGIYMIHLCLALGDDRYDIAEQIAAVVGMDDEVDIIALLFQTFLPLHADQPLLFIYDVGTVFPMDLDALPFGDVADDRIARHRRAAGSQLYHHRIDSRHMDAAGEISCAVCSRNG